MAKKYNGGIKSPTSLSVQKNEPSDDRTIVEVFTDLFTLDYVYQGLEVTSLDTGNKYTFLGGDQTQAANWVDKVDEERQRAESAEAVINNTITQLSLNNNTGVTAVDTLADLPVTGTANVSYKVTNDVATPANNGYYTWNGASYDKDAELVLQTVQRTNTSTATSGKAQYDFTVQQSKIEAIGILGNKNISDDLPQASGYIENPGCVTMTKVTVAEELPVSTGYVLRGTYDNAGGAEGRIDLTTPLTRASAGTPMYHTGWIRKADLLAIPGDITFMAYTLPSTDVIKLPYIDKVNLIPGYFLEGTSVGGTAKLKVEILAEQSIGAESWVLFYCTFESTHPTDTQYIPRIYFDGLDGTSRTIDFVNLTAYSGQANSNLLLPSLKSGETYEDPVQENLTQGLLAANLRMDGIDTDIDDVNERVDLSALRGLDYLGRDRVADGLPQWDGFKDVGGQTVSQLEGVLNLPSDTDKVLRSNYTIGAEANGRVDIPNAIPMVEGEGNFFTWVNKADIIKTTQCTVMMYAKDGSDNTIDVNKLPYIPAASLIKGYHAEQSTTFSHIVLDVLAEKDGWVLIFAKYTNTNPIAVGFIPRFYYGEITAGIFTGVLDEDKVDFVNYTAYSGQDNINITLSSLKAGETYIGEVEEELNASILASATQADILSKSGLNYLGSNAIVDKFPTLDGFVVLPGTSLSEVSTSEADLPIDTNKIFRLDYTAVAEGRIDVTTSLPMSENSAKFTSWVRKSDLANIPVGFTIMMFGKEGATIKDIIKLPYMVSTQFVKGYHVENTEGNSTLVLDVLAERGDWVLFFAEYKTTDVLMDSYIPRFYFGEILAGEESKLDFINFTTYSGQDNINITLQSVKEVENSLIPFFKDVVEVNPTTSEAIDFVGDSYTESYYTLKDKSYISRVAELLPYRVKNFAKSGDDIIEAIVRIETNETRFGSPTGYKDWEATYTAIVLYANDSVYRDYSIDMFKENMRQLVERIRIYGREPIIFTEFFLYNFFSDNPGVVDTTLFKDLAEELQVQFVDVAQTSLNFGTYPGATRHGDFWNGSHPTARTNSVLWKPISDFLKTLPRPKQSMKIYRNRFIESSFFVDTLYKNDIEKIQKYQEITVGHAALTEVNEIYLDRSSLVTGPIARSIADEYFSLEKNEAVSFDRHALIECILPYNSRDIDYIRVRLSANKQVYPWIMKKKDYFSSAKGTSFRATAPFTASVGDVYTITASGLTTGDATITRIEGDYIIFSGYNYTYPGSNTSGTLTKVSGAGDASISFDKVKGGFLDDYYDNYDKTQEWEQAPVAESDGYFYLDNRDRRFVQGDLLTIIVRELSGFDITDISVEIPKKDKSKIAIKSDYITAKIGGSEKLSQTVMLSGLPGWITTGGMTHVDPIGNARPRFLNGVTALGSGKSLTQAINLSTDKRQSEPAQLKIWASYEPPKFEGVDINLSPVKALSYDKVTLEIEIYSDGISPIKLTREIGQGFHETLINLTLPPDLVNPYIKLSGESDYLLIGYVSLKQ